MKLIVIVYKYKENRYLIVRKPYDHEDSIDDIRRFHLKGNFSCDCNRSRNIGGFDCPQSIREMIPAVFMSPTPRIDVTCYPDFPVLPCGEEITVESIELKEMTEEQLLALVEFFRTHAIQAGADGYYELEVHPEVLRGGDPT